GARDQLRDPDLGRGRGRDGVQHPGPRPVDRVGGPPPRLPGDPGRGAVRGGRLHAGQPGRRSLVSRHRSPREVPVTPLARATRVIDLPRAGSGERRRAPAWLAVLARRKITLAGLVLVAVIVVVGALAPVIAGDPTTMDVAARLARPGQAHWFGTDDVGRDVYSRVVHGARL